MMRTKRQRNQNLQCILIKINTSENSNTVNVSSFPRLYFKRDYSEIDAICNVLSRYWLLFAGTCSRNA